MIPESPEIDEVGRWTELKLEILREYFPAYTKILSSETRGKFTYIYVDAFSGPGVHISKTTGKLIQGSPLYALHVQPPFKEYHFIDLDGNKIENLRAMIDEREGRDVFLYKGDCNEVIPRDLLKRVNYEDYRRGLFLIDPYGINLDWKVVESIGKKQTIDMVLNFMIMDMNMNVLKENPEATDSVQIARMNRFWGDSSWRQVAYSPSSQPDLFGGDSLQKNSNQAVVDGYVRRLKEVAGFKYVSKPIAMKNSNRTTVYYLLFASANKTAAGIVDDIFDKYRKRG